MSATHLPDDQARHLLYDVMQQDLPFEEKANRALELGEAYLGVQNAHLTRIDDRVDFWEAIASTDPPDGDFPPGEVLDLQTTYCRRVIENESTIALEDAPEQGWADDPAFQEHGLHCYHGTPLTIDGEVWGTLCFVSEDPRAEPFTVHETLFAELIARLLEHELRRTRQEAEINLQSNLIGVLSRVLRHNLRNDLNLIRGQLTMMAEQSSEPLLENLSAINKIDKLVDLANTARKIESIASSDLDRQPIELTALLENVIERVQRNHPNASFSIESPEEIYLEAIPSLRTGLEELVENAAKHSGDTPEVTVSIESTSDAVNIEILDNGPGLPQHEREVLREGSESPLIHGSGLGLWLTYWIISNHDGSIETEVTNDGTRITVTLPRTASLSEFADSEALLGRFHREQDKFEAVFEESFDAILIFDNEGRYTDANRSAADLFGLPQDELLGRSIADFVPEDFDLDAAWAEFMNSERVQDTYPLRRADGTLRTVEFTVVTDIIPGQHLGILRDVTERIEREEQLQRARDRMERAVEMADAVVWEWEIEPDRVTTHPSPHPIIGEPVEVLDDFIENTHPEDRAIVQDAVEEALETQSSYEVTFRVEKEEGLRWIEDYGEVHVDESGEPERISGIARDVTDRIKRERRYEALSKGFPDLCFIFDEDGVYRDVLTSPANENILIGKPDELVGQAVTDVLPADQGQLVQRNIEETLDTGEPQTFRYELHVPAGMRVFEGRTYPLSEWLEGERMVSMVARDITGLPSGEEAAGTA